MVDPYKYNPVGAASGLFAPAYIAGNPEAMAAAGNWNTAHLQTPPPVADVPPGTYGAVGNVNAGRNRIAQTLMRRR